MSSCPFEGWRSDAKEAADHVRVGFAESGSDGNLAGTMAKDGGPDRVDCLEPCIEDAHRKRRERDSSEPEAAFTD